MQTKSVSLRFEKDLLDLLRDGSLRTSRKKQDLIRITLRRYLPVVIEEEARSEEKRITNVEPWPDEVLEKLYSKPNPEWDKVEKAALRTRRPPRFDD